MDRGKNFTNQHRGWQLVDLGTVARRKRAFWLLLCGAIAALGVATYAIRAYINPESRQPAYGGRTVSEWLDGGYEPAALAVHEIGHPAVPWIFRKLRYEHPRWDYWGAYRRFRKVVPGNVASVMPQGHASGFDDLRAANLLLSIGTPALSMMRTGLKDGNPTVRSACQLALQALSVKAGAAQQQRQSGPEPSLRKPAD